MDDDNGHGDGIFVVGTVCVVCALLYESVHIKYAHRGRAGRVRICLHAYMFCMREFATTLALALGGWSGGWEGGGGAWHDHSRAYRQHGNLFKVD